MNNKLENELIAYVVKENACIIKAYFELQKELLNQYIPCGKKNELAELLDKVNRTELVTKFNKNNEYIYICSQEK